MTKDLLGALGPLVVVAMFFWLTGERPLTLWVPWWGVLLLVATALPWYVLVEAESRGFLRYTLVESRVLSGAGPRVFPDEDAARAEERRVGQDCRHGRSPRPPLHGQATRRQ